MDIALSVIFFASHCMAHSGSVVEGLTQDRGAAGSNLTGVTALCPQARHINPSLVLVQPRKTHPYITVRLLMGLKESNQTKTKQTTIKCHLVKIVITWSISPDEHSNIGLVYTLTSHSQVRD